MKLIDIVWKIAKKELKPGTIVECMTDFWKERTPARCIHINKGDRLTVSDKGFNYLYFEERTVGYDPTKFRKVGENNEIRKDC